MGKKFRIQAKHLFLTYPQVKVKDMWTFWKALQQNYTGLKGKDRSKPLIGGFCVGREIHADGGLHYHVYIRLIKILDIKNTHTLDVVIDGVTYHGNYQRVKNISAIINYCKKGNEYIQHNVVAGLASTVINCRDKFDMMMVLDRANCRRDRAFWERVYDLNRQKEQHRKRLELCKHIVQFQWHKRFINPESIMGWVKGDDKRPKGLIAAGPSETGKTSFVLRLAGSQPYFVATQPRHFSKYAGEGIIALDEFEWANWRKDVSFLKNLITGMRVQTPSYYGSHWLTTPRIVVICTNEDPKIWNMPPALSNRFYLFRTDTHSAYRWADGAWKLTDFGNSESEKNAKKGPDLAN